jgi:hypothetical protein
MVSATVNDSSPSALTGASSEVGAKVSSAAQLMGHQFRRLAQGGLGLLQSSGQSDPAPLVAEVAANLALDGGPGEGCEVVAAVHVEALDRQHQAEVPDLSQLVHVDGLVGVLPGQPAHQPGVPADQQVLHRALLGETGRPHRPEQFQIAVVGEARLQDGRVGGS